MDTVSRWQWLTGLLFLLGCSTTPSPTVSTVSIAPENFQLELHAEWGRVGSGASLEIFHRLTNWSKSAVCIGGSGAFLMNGRSLRAWALSDAICSTPLRIVQPGDTLEWSMPWSGFECMETGPEGFLEAFPWLRCGAVIELKSELSVFVPPWDQPFGRSARVVSTPQRVRLVAGASALDTLSNE